MKVLVLGSGGREHAICRGLSLSPEVTKLFCSPGNPGIAQIAECVALPSGDNEAVADFAAKNGIDLLVVGPELPLCQGVADAVRAKGIAVFGPSKAGARLEGSKDFSKQFMVKYGIPTAKYASFTSCEPALEYVASEYAAGRGIVVKADGLAAGKGVVVAADQAEAEAAVRSCFDGKFGSAGSLVVLEELLEGEEASILALTDGQTIVPLVSSQDHKRLLDHDRGPNTGGMGAYSPAPVVTDRLMAEVREQVLDRFLTGIRAEKLDYRGIIYAGIMVTKDGPKVLEFNVRFGDPETEAILPRLKSSLFDVLYKTANGQLAQAEMVWSKMPCVGVVMASAGYPGTLEKGFPISGIADAEAAGCIVFHAGTAVKDGAVVNSGGRVLVVSAEGATVEEAVRKAYAGVRKISWKGVQFRTDIAWRAMNRGK
ncbi:MAG: phosphoribosylamine--glycine ligase [Lentisphaeria bacterium]|nr:phosphoribosylamine--glycine ligase [Lentisphaeria bacterium]